MLERKRNPRPSYGVKGYNMNECVTDNYGGLNRYPDLDRWYQKYQEVLGYKKIFFTEGVSGAIKNIYEIIKPKETHHHNDFALYRVFDQIYKGEGNSVCFVTHPDTNVEEMSENFDHVVIDDAYQFFCPRNWNDCLEISNVTLMRSFSKAWGLGGIRLGYVTGELTDILSYHRGGYEANTLSLQVAYDRLINPRQKDWYIKQCKESLEFLLSTGKYAHDGFTNGVFRKGHKIYGILKDHGILVKPCDGYVRITLGPIDEMQKIHEIIENNA